MIATHIWTQISTEIIKLRIIIFFTFTLLKGHAINIIIITTYPFFPQHYLVFDIELLQLFNSVLKGNDVLVCLKMIFIEFLPLKNLYTEPKLVVCINEGLYHHA